VLSAVHQQAYKSITRLGITQGDPNQLEKIYLFFFIINRDIIKSVRHPMYTGNIQKKPPRSQGLKKQENHDN